MSAAAEPAAARGWGSRALRRATLTLAVTQLVSWGVLFYGFAVVAPAVTADTGWAESTVAGAFSLGLLVAGVSAPTVARAVAREDPRRVMTAGSLVGGIGMLMFAGAPHVAIFYAAWALIGVAMATTLYEPAMAVVVAIDPARRHRTLATITVAGGLASTVFAPVGGALVDHLGWRSAVAVLGIGAATGTALLHALVLPRSPAISALPEPASPAVLASPGVHRLRTAVLFEQAAVVATTAHLIGLLVDQGTTLATAGAVLGVMGVGKLAGRLLLLGPLGRRPLPPLAVACNAIQLAGLAVPLITIGTPALAVSAAVVGAASGATTVLRPLLIVELVGPGPFAAVSARLQRSTTVARAMAPFALGTGVSAFGWRPTWVVAVATFGIAAERYSRLHAIRHLTTPVAQGRKIRPPDARGV